MPLFIRTSYVTAVTSVLSEESGTSARRDSNMISVGNASLELALTLPTASSRSESLLKTHFTSSASTPNILSLNNILLKRGTRLHLSKILCRSSKILCLIKAEECQPNLTDSHSSKTYRTKTLTKILLKLTKMPLKNTKILLKISKRQLKILQRSSKSSLLQTSRRISHNKKQELFLSMLLRPNLSHSLTKMRSQRSRNPSQRSSFMLVRDLKTKPLILSRASKSNKTSWDQA